MSNPYESPKAVPHEEPIAKPVQEGISAEACLIATILLVGLMVAVMLGVAISITNVLQAKTKGTGVLLRGFDRQYVATPRLWSTSAFKLAIRNSEN